MGGAEDLPRFCMHTPLKVGVHGTLPALPLGLGTVVAARGVVVFRRALHRTAINGGGMPVAGGHTCWQIMWSLLPPDRRLPVYVL